MNEQIERMKFMDERMKTMNEILVGIKALKLYGWESSFEAIVQGLRKKELCKLRQIMYTNAATGFLFFSVPFLVSFVSFLTFILIDGRNFLDATKIFVSLSLFNILRFPLGKFNSNVSLFFSFSLFNDK